MITDYMIGERKEQKQKTFKPNIKLRLKILEKYSFKPYQMLHTNHFQTSHHLNKILDHAENADLPK